MWERGPRVAEGTSDVHVHHEVVGLDGRVERAGHDADPRIVHEHVEPTQERDGFGHAAHDPVGVGRVGPQEPRGSEGSELLLGVGPQRLVASGDDDRGTVGERAASHLQAETRGAPRDQHRLPVKRPAVEPMVDRSLERSHPVLPTRRFPATVGRYPGVSFLDVFLVLLIVMTAIGGYRRGALLQVFGLAGVVIGVAVGVAVAPEAGAAANEPLTRVAIVLGVVVLGAFSGNLLGYLVAVRVRRRVHRPTATTDGSPKSAWSPGGDAVLGAGVSVTAMLLVTWFLALNLANGPFPTVARGIKDSAILQAMAATLPPPPPLVPQLERFADVLGFPDVFIGLPSAGEPTEPPSSAAVQAAKRAAAGSTVQVLGQGCAAGFLNEGSGFVAAPGYVVTNAHVVAGVTDTWVRFTNRDFDATVVTFEPNLDLAVLRVPDLTAPALPLVTEDLPRGTGAPYSATRVRPG